MTTGLLVCVALLGLNAKDRPAWWLILAYAVLTGVLSLIRINQERSPTAAPTAPETET